MNFLKSTKGKVLAISLAAATVVLTFFLVDSYSSFFTFDSDEALAENAQRVEAEIIEPTMLYGMVVDSLHIIEDVVKRNQRFTDLFEGHYISPSVFQQLHFVPRSVFDFRKIVANRKYTLLTHRDSLSSIKAIVYEPNPIDYIIFHLEDTLLVETCQREMKTVEKTITGVIQSSLFETIDNMGVSPELTNRFVDIFAWQVDFQRLQKGDKFKLIYEENLVDNQPIGIGQINAVYFEHFGNSYYAFPFDQGEGLDYFDEKGNSLRKALLKYPIEFTRISSRYSRSRFHPVAKVFRAHLGTDFAAATGTPIRSVGDGIIVEAQYKANNGNYVKIRHNSTYTTQYLHMSKIASGIHAGGRVRQGQTIGFVGSTGLATGPHLCYRFWKNGVQVDALKVDLPPSQPIRKEFDGPFSIVKEKLTDRLNRIPFPEEQVEDVTVAGR